jgi:hypothetical protein
MFEEDYRTWVAYLTDFVEDNDAYVEMTQEFVNLLSAVGTDGRLPDPIADRTDEFLNITTEAIIASLASLSIPTPADAQAMVQHLANAAVTLVRMLSQEHDVLLKPLSLLFTAKRAIYSSKGAPNGFSSFCRHFFTSNGLEPLKQRLEAADPMPRQLHFFLHLWLLLRLESQMVLPNSAFVQFWGAAWHRFPDFLRAFDEKSLRAADSDQLLEIISIFFHRQRTPLPERNAVFQAILEFAFLCLRSNFIEKQILATKIFTVAIQKLTNQLKATLREWLGDNDVFEFTIVRNLHEKVLSQVVSFLKEIVAIRPPSASQITRLWEKAQRTGSSEYSVILSCAFRGCGEAATSSFVETVISEVPTKARLDFLRSVADGSSQAVAATIVTHITSLLAHAEFGPLAYDCLRAVAGDSHQTSTRGVLLSHCKRAVLLPDATHELFSLLITMLDGSPQIADDIDDGFVTALIDALETSPYKIGILDLITLSFAGTTLVFSEAQFGKFWNEIDSGAIHSLASIMRERNLDFVDRGLLNRHIIAYDYRRASAAFASFLTQYIAIEGVLGGQIRQIGGRGRAALSRPVSSVGSLDIPGLPCLLRVITEAADVGAVVHGASWLLGSLLTSSIPTSAIGAFLLDAFRPTLASRQPLVAVSLISDLITRYILQSETFVSIEDYGVARHAALPKGSRLELTVTFQERTQRVFVDPFTTIRALTDKLATRFSLPKDSFVLYHNGKAIRGRVGLRDAGIFHDDELELRTVGTVASHAYPRGEVPTEVFRALGLCDVLQIGRASCRERV